MTVMNQEKHDDIFGPVYTRLVDEKQWHDLCPPNTTEVCSDQEVKLQSIYSTGLLMNVLGHEIFGTLLDMIGPRYMTLIAYVFSVIGKCAWLTETLLQAPGSCSSSATP
ncbi:unnamed protein product [Aphanomyces euteiches]